jgi:uncharacterized protein DUF642/protein with PEP-CTERM/exosortase system signal
MTTRKHAFYGILALVSLLGLGVTQSARANLITNGDFETPVVVSPFGFEYRIGSSIDNWIIGTSNRGVIQFNDTYRPVDAGLQSVQIETLGDVIYQSFVTSVGTLYHVSFDLSAYDSNGGVIGVSVGGLFIDFTGVDASYMSYGFDFTALSNMTTLTFRNDGINGIQFPHFDNVVVNAAGVPDAGSTLSLLSLASLGLVALRRKLRC